MYWTLFQVGSCDVKFPIRLEGLVLTHSQVCHYILPHMNIVDHCWQFASFVDLSMTCFQFSSYEPELFPGLIYRCHFVNLCGSFTLKIQFLSNIVRMVKPRIVLLIFVSGKVVLTGAKVCCVVLLCLMYHCWFQVRTEIYEAFENIYPILKNFKKQWKLILPASGPSVYWNFCLCINRFQPLVVIGLET